MVIGRKALWKREDEMNRVPNATGFYLTQTSELNIRKFLS